MMLVRENDQGTIAVVPRLNQSRDRVIVELFSDGERSDCVTYWLAEWPGKLATMTAGDYREEDGLPDVRVVLNPGRPCLRIAGSIDNSLTDPRAGTDEDPVDPLIDQADDLMCTAGYMRLTAWWADPNGLLSAVAVPHRPSDADPEVRAIVQIPLNRALRVIRAQLMPLDTVQDVTAWLDLCGDPMEDGFGDIVGRTVDGLISRGKPAEVIDALRAAHRAIALTYHGDSAGAVEEAHRATRTLGLSV